MRKRVLGILIEINIWWERCFHEIDAKALKLFSMLQLCWRC